MNILLTNDDSHDSPLFLIAVEQLQQFGDVSIVVPAAEQSWTGKSMSRFDGVSVDTIDLHGHAAYAVTGTPADCVSLGIHNLLREPPDVVVSGINIGVNTGIGFVLSSGTVGACLEGNIAGVPGLALSQQIDPNDFRAWGEERTFSDEALANYGEIARTMVAPVFREFVLGGSDPRITWNVNLPSRLDSSEVVRTHLGRTYYSQVFRLRGDQYRHEVANRIPDTRDLADATVLQSGRASASRIDISEIGQLA